MAEHMRIIRSTHAGGSIEEHFHAPRLVAARRGANLWIRHHDTEGRIVQVTSLDLVERNDWFPTDELYATLMRRDED